MVTEVIEDAAAFTALREEWNELLADSPADCLFLTWEWLHTWWTHLGEGRRPAIVTVRDNTLTGTRPGGRLIGLAPLAARAADPRRPMPFASLEFLGSGTAGSDYLDLILRRGRESEALDSLAAWLEEKNQPLELNQLRSGSAAALLSERLHSLGWNTEQVKTNVCPYISLAGRSWDDYLAALGSEHRYNFQRKWKKLGREGEVSFTAAQTEEQREEAFAALLALHQKRWATRGETSDAFHTPAHQAFHREFTQLALCRGWLRLYLLRLQSAETPSSVNRAASDHGPQTPDHGPQTADHGPQPGGHPLSALLGFRYGPWFYFFQSGFDPGYARLSLGLLTMGLAIRSAIEEGAAEYDLLHGAEEYKFHWASESRDLFRLELFPAGVRGLWLQRAVAATRAARRLARQVLRKA